MSFITGTSPLIAELLRSLGLTDLHRVAGVNLDIRPDEPVRMVVGFYVEENEIQNAYLTVRDQELYLSHLDGSRFSVGSLDKDLEVRDIAHRLMDSVQKKPPTERRL